MVLKIVLSFADIGYFATSILRVVVGFLTGGAVIALVIGREAYKSLEIHPIRTTLALLLAGIFHLGFCLILMFYPFIAGGVRYLAGLLCMGSGFDSADCIPDIFLWAYLAAFFIYLMFQIGCALLGALIGKRMRLKIRASLKGYPNGDSLRQ